MAVAKDNDRIVVTVSKEVKEQLERLADKDNRSLSNYASTILQRHVEKEKERS